jgi:predicted NAD/FAD-dependent oxidoreductase
MATRRFQNGIFDHGAQFFTVRDPTFEALVADWQERGLILRWANGFAQPNGETKLDGHPRYRGRNGMTAIAKALAQTLEVEVNTHVRAISSNRSGWLIHLQTGETRPARGVIMTAPVPQSLALLQAGQITLPTRSITALQSMTYDPCIALLALAQEASAIPTPGAVQFEEGPIRWIADNHQKGISPDGFAITIHASPGFSKANWEQDDQIIAGQLFTEAGQWIRGEIAGYQIHRWRYSQPRQVYPERALVVPGRHPLIFAGDAFGGPKVEGAARAGLHAADRLLSWS